MSISFLDNIAIKKQSPNVERDLFETVADMVAFSENYLPAVFECNVKEDGKRYRYNVSNSVDDELGKWREVAAGGSADLTDYYNKKSTEDLIADSLKDANDYTDEQISLLNKNSAIACDEKPTYEDGTIHYKQDGENKETEKTDIWFYYAEDEVLYQTIFIEGVEKTIVSGGGTDFSEYIKKEDGASGVTFEDEDHPLWTDLDKAVKGLIAKVEYVKPEIKTFTVTPSTTTYEVGQKVSSLTFNWTLNKDVTSQTLTDCTVTAEDRTATYDTELSTTKTFVLKAGDGENSVEKSIAINFRNKAYWGSAASKDAYDSAFILGLGNSAFATAVKGTYEMTVGAGEYGFLAVPSSFTKIGSWDIGGFDIDLVDEGTISFTNASGGVTTYRIYRTTQPKLGSIKITVK